MIAHKKALPVLSLAFTSQVAGSLGSCVIIATGGLRGLVWVQEGTWLRLPQTFAGRKM